ncbi:tagatose-6-phosphate ketose isomerase [Paucibacter sp. Y2R2-4]|uniref:tagatose-6-phosphate ketose isomerase n=1 Tax=Paucibacter sp. Y2R2-4 TaxID=2893553 RepID=UPI0021E48042|nr:tagatose-6-phosphate ketose isomerase [Paucibacter sp. Y2R2-4]MCV2351492.1 tagatose-6-phosphate ketose isomerase [Paucibacter sp. Y2R2-4]
MNSLLHRTPAAWHELKGLHTAEEIGQQARIWRELGQSLQAQQAEIDGFLNEWLSKPEHLVIFTGAGSSAYCGEAVVERANKAWAAEVRAVPTTSLISHPGLYLQRGRPTLLVSFARSGNSPESLGAVDLLRQLVDAPRFLNITCNAEGELYSRNRQQADTLNLLMPAASCDRGFAMTSSFSSMQLAALLAFSTEAWPQRLARLEALAAQAEQLLQDWAAPVAGLAEQPFTRIVYLGSGPMEALAKEAALKVLELTCGRVLAFANTPLGFRHGPKSILDKNTLVLLFPSSDAYARRFDEDLLAELRRDQVAGRVIQVGLSSPTEANSNAESLSCQPSPELLAGGDEWLAPLWLLMAQQYALQRSVSLGLTPDNPFPDGTVNRVVQGVTLHSYDEAR